MVGISGGGFVFEYEIEVFLFLCEDIGEDEGEERSELAKVVL